MTLFLVTYFLARYIHEEHVKTVISHLDAGAFNTNAIKDYITTDGNGTRTIVSNLLSDISSTTAHISKHTSNVTDASTLTLLENLNGHSKILTNHITENNLVLVSENSKVFETLLELQIC